MVVGQFELDGLRTDKNRISKEVARLKIVSAPSTYYLFFNQFFNFLR